MKRLPGAGFDAILGERAGVVFLRKVGWWPGKGCSDAGDRWDRAVFGIFRGQGSPDECEWNRRLLFFSSYGEGGNKWGQNRVMAGYYCIDFVCSNMLRSILS